MTELEKCKLFLTNNGYENIAVDSEYVSYHKEGVSGIDMNEDEIVFIDDSGDWLHIPLNYFALIGACIHYSQIGVGYKHWVQGAKKDDWERYNRESYGLFQ